MRHLLPRAASLSVLALFLVSLPAHAQQPGFSFQGMGGIPSGGLVSVANHVSADGGAVAGSANVSGGLQAVRWTQADGLLGLGDLPGGDFSSQARAISPEGLVAVGSSISSNGSEAFRWTAEGGMVGIGDLPGPGSFSSFANSVSANGATIVGQTQRPSGTSEYSAFRWTEATGMQSLGELAGGDDFAVALDVTDDGSVVVGGGSSSLGSEAFMWTAAGGMVGLGDLPSGGFSSSAQAVAADGGAIVGGGQSDRGFEAFRWTASGGMVGLGDLPGVSFSSGAADVSADGNVIVGTGSASNASGAAFLWTPLFGTVSLKHYLTAHGVTDVEDWFLYDARGVSSDGKTIVGLAINPAGDFEGYIATIEIDDAADLGETIAPSGVTPLAGSSSGGVLQVAASDNSYLRLSTRGSSVMQVLLEGTLSQSNTSELWFDIESATSRSGAIQRVELFDFVSGSWVLKDTRVMVQTDNLATVDAGPDAGRFVEPGALTVRARVSWQHPTAKKGHVTEVRVDSASWARVP